MAKVKIKIVFEVQLYVIIFIYFYLCLVSIQGVSYGKAFIFINTPCFATSKYQILFKIVLYLQVKSFIIGFLLFTFF
jgi:hypothetical protein